MNKMEILKGAGMKNKVLTALVAMGMMASLVNAGVVSKNGIAKDSAGLMWQDNADAVTDQKDWERSKGY
jgi:opacity protein-like surface antigen